MGAKGLPRANSAIFRWIYRVTGYILPANLNFVATFAQTDQSPAPPVVGERVLIVEDDPATRVGLSELVGAWGFQTDEAANGEEALQKITSFRPAIIVSDLVMP